MAYKVISPVLFLVFNRLETTRRVFKAIASAKPAHLYVASDGPRAGKNEEGVVTEVREWIMENIDWECEVKTLFRENNMGCKMAVSGAISWFFEQEEMGIILEDDCLPATSFFQYCDELLERYKGNSRIMSITGTLSFDNKPDYPESYHFSNRYNCWGWASWRRAWSTYDVEMKIWTNARKRREILKSVRPDFLFIRYWTRVFNMVHTGRISSWAYPMALNVWSQAGLCISPSRNMIENIGFDEFATHTSNPLDKRANRRTENIEFPLKHPLSVIPNQSLDILEDTLVLGISWQTELKIVIRRRLSDVKQLLRKSLRMKL